MPLSLHSEVLELVFSEPFRIARTEESEAVRTVALGLDLDGARGLGECYPLAYYGETVDTVSAVLPRLLGSLEALGPLPADRGAVPAWLERSTFLMTDVLGNHGAAKCGLDMALHDLAGKALGLPVSAVAVVRGASSRDKVVEIQGLSADEVRGRLLGNLRPD